MSYAVKEVFLTLQGEGAQSGRRAVFLRMAGCNLWSGREEDRSSADCRFCDTDFVGMDGANGGRYEAAALARRVRELWGLPLSNCPRQFEDRVRGARSRGNGERPLVVITGGEPLLQVDGALIDALHGQGFEIAVETNGTVPAPDGLDWICVSPKAGTNVVQRRGNELKLVWPQEGIEPDELLGWQFDHFLIQPMDVAGSGPCLAEAIELVMRDPRWRLSLQTHKILGLD